MLGTTGLDLQLIITICQRIIVLIHESHVISLQAHVREVGAHIKQEENHSAETTAHLARTHLPHGGAFWPERSNRAGDRYEVPQGCPLLGLTRII
jgi:hypothetical protein